MSNRAMSLFMGSLAIAAGVLVNYLADKLLGMRLELFWGVATFSPTWVIDLFLAPFIAGAVVSMVYGLGGKILCYFVPIILRSFSYIEMLNYEVMPDGVSVLPFWYWLLILIVAIEAAAFGGTFGEIIVKKTYGRRPRHLVYKEASDNNPSNPEK